MSLRPPSLQHLAKMSRRSSDDVVKELYKITSNNPQFSYQMLNSLIYGYLQTPITNSEILKGVISKEKRTWVAEIFQEIIPHLTDYLDTLQPDHVMQVAPRNYAIDKDLRVKFSPPIVYIKAGQLHLPWFSFWRNHRLKGQQLSLFVTMAVELIAQDPDLEMARFEIVDFSAPSPKSFRELTVTPAADIPKMSQAEKTALLEAFAEGYRRTEMQLANEASATKHKEKDTKIEIDQNQLPLFSNL